jgi:PTH1 family peptidyl-tRNA hydrolase
MNNSGAAVLEAADRHALITDALLVVIDDFQLPLGVLRLRARGSEGGHNGLGSVLLRFGTEDIPRLRCGIGKEVMPPPEARRDFVLAPFDEDELAVAREMVARAADAASLFATSGIHHAMNLYNAH